MWKYCNLIGSFFKYSILIGSPLYWPILLLWFTSCLLSPMDKHLEEYDLLEGEQRGAKPRCRGTTDNLLVDRMVCHDSRNSRKNVSMAWIDVRKAFDSVSHEWLLEMMFLHKFPSWLCNTIKRLGQSWNTKITVRTRQGMETSDVIHFNKGLPQSDALCPRLFKLCLNPVSWKLKASEGRARSPSLPGNTRLSAIQIQRKNGRKRQNLGRNFESP